MKVAPSRPMPKGTRSRKAAETGLPPSGSAIRAKNFPELCERRVKYTKHLPRIRFIGAGPRIDDLLPAPALVVPPAAA